MVLLAEYSKEELGFQSYINMFLEDKKRKSASTYETYKSSLELMCRRIFDKDVSELTREDIEELTFDVINRYKSYLIEIKNSNTTINNRISSIKSFIRFLASQSVIKYDISQLPLVTTENDDSENTEMIPEDTFYEFVNYFENKESNGIEKKWATLLMLETGNRAEEVLKVNKNQFIKDGETYILRSKGSNKGKGNKEYLERIGSEMYDELMKLNPDSEKVFNLSYKALKDSFSRANDYFGNKLIRYTAHSVKHLAVTLEYRYTGCILEAQKKGKHSSIETTRRYLRISDNTTVGAHTRKISTKGDMYKQVNIDDLISIIDTLPIDIKQLINYKLEMNNK